MRTDPKKFADFMKEPVVIVKRLSKVGGSLVLFLPSGMAQTMNLSHTTNVKIQVAEDKIIIEKVEEK